MTLSMLGLFLSLPSACWVFLRSRAGVLGPSVGMPTVSEVLQLCEGVSRKLPPTLLFLITSVCTQSPSHVLRTC